MSLRLLLLSGPGETVRPEPQKKQVADGVVVVETGTTVGLFPGTDSKAGRLTQSSLCVCPLHVWALAQVLQDGRRPAGAASDMPA